MAHDALVALDYGLVWPAIVITAFIVCFIVLIASRLRRRPLVTGTRDPRAEIRATREWYTQHYMPRTGGQGPN